MRYLISAIVMLIVTSSTLWSGEILTSSRQKTCINTGWRFHRGDADRSDFYATQFDDSNWEVVTVPHTLKLSSLALDGCKDDKFQKTFQRTVGWYRRSITIAPNSPAKVFLEFEGAHQVTDLWVNGRHVGQHAVGGYTPFHFDITDVVNRGQANQITLRVDNRVHTDTPPDPGPFDYIKFSGLYRDVYLVQTDPIYIPFAWDSLDAGVFITTPSVDPVNMNAVIDIKTTVRNETGRKQPVEVINRVIDRSGRVVLKLMQTQTVFPQQDRVFNQIGAIEDDLHLWSVDNPYLYRVSTQVMVKDRSLDLLWNPLGIRKFEMDHERGFLLNGQPIELIGTNRHQHYGYIGDAMPDSLHYKDILQFKQFGFNVVRTAHYPQDNALIEACDRLGLLVYEEAPTWISISQDPVWYDHYESALRTMIRNHRNHPSVVIWGAGINHRGYVARAVLAAKQEDPTRLTASQSSRWTGWQTSGLTDIFANMMYGPGLWDRSEPLLAMEGWYGPEVVADYKRDPLKTGIISWTAHAYYTFHTDENLKDRTRLGMMTVFRDPRVDNSIRWYPAEMKQSPYLHIVGQWVEGTENLTIYSNADEVELLLNDQPFMKQGPSTDGKYAGLDHPPFHFKIDSFQPGKLTARGLRQGEIIAEETIWTPQQPVRVRLEMDMAGRELVADGGDIVVGYARVVDANGTLCRNADTLITFKVDGPGSIVGDHTDIGSNPLQCHNGSAPVLLRAGTHPGWITIQADAPGLQAGQAHIQSQPYDPDITARQAQTIYDFDKIRVDLGAADQLVQFDWTPMNGVDNQSAQQSFQAFGGFTASLKPAGDNGILRWLGEMNVIGKYGYVYGDGLVAIDPDGLLLTFQGLPAGVYRLRTWHHAPSSNTDSMDPNREKLKKLTIHKLPYSRQLAISVQDAGRNMQLTSPVSEGKEMQYKPAAVALTTFVSDGQHPVKIIFKDIQQEKGIWLNGFELSQWDDALE